MLVGRNAACCCRTALCFPVQWDDGTTDVRQGRRSVIYTVPGSWDTIPCKGWEHIEVCPASLLDAPQPRPRRSGPSNETDRHGGHARDTELLGGITHVVKP
jgi:hypothetical protein